MIERNLNFDEIIRIHQKACHADENIFAFLSLHTNNERERISRIILTINITTSIISSVCRYILCCVCPQFTLCSLSHQIKAITERMQILL